MSTTLEVEQRPPRSLVRRLDAALASRPLAAGAVSGLLLWTAFPPVAWNWLAWIALVPLFRLVTLEARRWKIYTAAWLHGACFWLLAVEWIRSIDPSAWLGWVALAGFFSFWPPLFVAFARLSVRQLQIPLLMAVPILWVGLEYSRAHILSGFPWYYLAHSQYLIRPLIQIADVTGALGVSFLIAITNALAVDLIALPLFRRTPTNSVRFCRRQYIRLWIVTFLIAGSLGYGAYRLATAHFSNGPTLALLQSNIEQRRKMKGDPRQIIAQLEALVTRAIARRQHDLIVWPETSYPYGYIKIEPGLPFDTLAKQVAAIAPKFPPRDWSANAPLIDAELHALADQARSPLLIGTLYYLHQAESLGRYNSAVLFEPGKSEVQIYNKMHLVPFGEYVPFVRTLPWLTALTPYNGDHIPSLSFGAQANSLKLGRYLLAVSICFEDTVPHVIRQFFTSDQQPDVLVNLSNDGWFHGTAELDMHLAIGVFRAIEHRVPLARSVNTGLSALIDGNGDIRDALPKETDGILSVTVPLDPRTTLFSRYGDWLGLGTLAITLGLPFVYGIRTLRAAKSPS